MKSFLLKLVLILIHLIYTVVEFVCKIWVYLRSWFNHEGFIKNEEQYLSRTIPLMKKIPSHLVVIIGTEEPSYQDLAHIILWCIASGIHFISFYDYKGVLKKTELELYNAVVARHKSAAQTIEWNKITTNGYKTNGYQNGSVKHHVNIFSFSDGQQKIAELTRHLVLNKKFNEININVVNESFYKILKIPEPDLAIYCNDLCCTYGFLPWHLRVTEFVQLPTHHSINVQTFVSILVKYNKCQQRYGK